MLQECCTGCDSKSVLPRVFYQECLSKIFSSFCHTKCHSKIFAPKGGYQLSDSKRVEPRMSLNVIPTEPLGVCFYQNIDVWTFGFVASILLNDCWSFSWNSTETCWEVLFGARFRMLCRWFQIHIIILYHLVFPFAASNFDDSAREVALKSRGSLPSGNDWQLAIEDGHRNVVSFPMQTYGDFP